MGAAALPASIGLQAGGTYLAMEGARASAMAQQGYYKYLANESDNNANLVELAAERQSHEVQDTASLTFGQLERGYKQLKGAQRAATGAAGISGGVTAEDIARDTENKQTLDEMAIRFNADNQASEVLRQAGITAMNLRGQASGYRMSASEAERAGEMNRMATLIGGATSIAGTAASAYKPAAMPTSPASGGSSGVNGLTGRLSLFSPAGAPRQRY